MSIEGLRRLGGAVEHREYARKFSADDRKQAAKDGAAMPGGRYPIYSQTDLDNAVKDYNRTGQSPAVREHIIRRAKALGLKHPFND